MENTRAKEFYLRETGWIEPNEEFDENTWDNTIVEEYEKPKSVVELMVKYSNDQTTQLREENERLKEFINWALNQDDYSSISGRAQFIRKAQQLLKEQQ